MRHKRKHSIGYALWIAGVLYGLASLAIVANLAWSHTRMAAFSTLRTEIRGTELALLASPEPAGFREDPWRSQGIVRADLTRDAVLAEKVCGCGAGCKCGAVCR